MVEVKPTAVFVVIDPGKATGLVIGSIWRKPAGIEVDSDDDLVITHRLFNKFAIKIHQLTTIQFDTIYTDLIGSMQYADDLGKKLGVPVKLVGEAFIITNTAQRGASTWSLEIIGGSKALRDTQFTHWSAYDFSQKSSDAKSIITNTVLKDCGLVSKAIGRKLTPHEQDALRHLLLHVSRVQTKKTTV